MHSLTTATSANSADGATFTRTLKPSETAVVAKRNRPTIN